MEKEMIITSELDNVVEYEKGVSTAVKVAGVKGLSHEKAMELGYYDRISNLLALLTASLGAAYRVYGHIDALLTAFGVKRHEIKKNCTTFEEAWEKFLNFWGCNGYFEKERAGDMEKDIDELYRLLMRFGRLPIEWGLGDEQRVEKAPVALRIDDGDRWLNLFKTVLTREFIGEPEKQWCVTKFDENTRRQDSVYTGMEKADAMMVAKRLSAEDPKNIYSASVLTEFTEKRTEIMPMHAYRNNVEVGQKGKSMEV